MLKNITKILLYCYVENHFYPWLISFKKEKKKHLHQNQGKHATKH